MLHERADSGVSERRGAVKTMRAVQISSIKNGLHGIADLVELHGKSHCPHPIEYKRGRPKEHLADEIQLCAQAICLEEMFDVSVDTGALFYGKLRRRKQVHFDLALRSTTLQAAEEARAAITSGLTPMPHYNPKKCDACSLYYFCRPKQMQKKLNIDTWLEQNLIKNSVPE